MLVIQEDPVVNQEGPLSLVFIRKVLEVIHAHVRVQVLVSVVHIII